MTDSTHGEPATDRAVPLVRAYVNETGVSVPPGSTALDAVRAFSAAEADALAAGTRRLTDSRGLPVDAATVLHGGAIFRLLPVREAVPADGGPDDATPARPAESP